MEARVTRISEVLNHKGSSVVTIAPEASVRDLVAQLAHHRIGAVVVSRDGASVLGIVSERDVVRRLDGADSAPLLDRLVSELMTTSVVTCTPDSSVDDVMKIMTERRVRHVPVVEDSRLIGLVSIGDVVLASIDEIRTERDQLTAYITS
jgi:CBS domain-containing protein